MTLTELSALIAGDAEAAAMFAAGNDVGCAARCVTLSQPLSVSTGYTYLGLIAVNSDMTRRLMISMLAVGPSDPVVSFLDDCFRGKNTQSEFPGVDVSMLGPLLTGLVAANVPNGLQSADIATITDLAKRPQQITADMVSATRGP